MMNRGNSFTPEDEGATTSSAESQPQTVTQQQQQQQPAQATPTQPQPMETEDIGSRMRAAEVLEQPVTPPGEAPPTRTVATEDTHTTIQQPQQQQQPQAQSPTIPSLPPPVQQVQPQTSSSQPVLQPLPSQSPQINPIHHLAMQPNTLPQPNSPVSSIPPPAHHIPSPTHPQPQLSSPQHPLPSSLSHPVPLLPIAQSQGPPTLPQPQISPTHLREAPLPSSLHPPQISSQGTPPHLLPQTPPPIITSQPLRPPNSTSPYVPPQQPATPPPRQVKFENALEFLDQVKLQFAKQPRVYNQFLDIMKDFKSQYIDTPGVIARVTELFKGHKHLILGFNTFLPPGYKIELPDDDKPAPAPSPAPVSSAAQQSAPRKQPEFDHARNYVKKIKTRFNTQPEVYKAFLEILHTYHKEQHTIKDVFDQVAKLFANHSDLLEEFTQFLPDNPGPPGASMGVPPAIPAPATIAAQSASSARGKTRPTRMPTKSRAMPPPSPVEREVARPERNVPERRTLKRQARGTRSEETPAKRAAHDDDDTPVRGVDTRSEREREREKEREKERVAPSGNYEELDFFYRVKNTLNNKVLYHEFLKCLNLFSQEIINRAELVLLVKDLLSRYPELFDWFKQFIGFDDHSLAELLETKKEQEENRFQPWSEIDFTQCKRNGPSYRALPKSYIGAKCSGRTELCQSVLNDVWVSVPTGSEDFTFKNMRKNQYEEVLFKCEDERYELDLVVELNCSAIRALEKFTLEFEKLSEEEANNYKIKTPLDILHVRSIERLYGEKGAEIIEGLYANPVVAIPVILNRLKQKDQEWTNSRREWNKVWHEVTEKNYYKSLDHQSFFFKQQEKKNLSPKVLLAEIKMQYADRLREKEQEKEAAASKERRSQRVKDKEKEKEATEVKAENDEETHPKYHLKYVLDNAAIIQDISELMLFTADNTDKSFSKADKEKIETFLKHFLHVFYRFDSSPAPGEPMETTQTKPAVNVKTEPMDVDKQSAAGSVDGKSEDKQKEEKRVKQLFFGNNTFYIFFRLFQITYERLAKAKELAKISQKAKWNSKPVRPPTHRANGDAASLSQPPSPSPSPLPSPPHNPSTTSPVPSVPSPASGVPATSPTNANNEKKDKDRYQSFIDKLYSLLAGATDQTHYEDETRGLLGISSYILFTLDKLIIQLTRQLQALLLSENCSKLLSLYSYESQRPNGVVESVYHMSCAEFLNEERLFAFEFEQYPHTGAFTIQLLDPSSHTTPKFVDFSFEPSRYSEYVTSFTRDSSKIDPKKHHVFLIRNQKINRENDSILNGVVNENNLECRICLSTYRLFYVEDTEDFFFRPKSARPPRPTTPTTNADVNNNSRVPHKRRGNVSQMMDKIAAARGATTTTSAQTTADGGSSSGVTKITQE